MKIERYKSLLTLLLCVFAAVNIYAQEPKDEASQTVPDLHSLPNDWWSHFEGTRAEIEPRVGTFLDEVGAQTAELSPQNQVIAQSVLETVRDNFAAYLALLDDTELELQDLPAAAVSYSIGDLLRLASVARDARGGASEEQLEVEREQRILDGVRARRDSAFKDYVDVAAGDERWLAALRLVQARSALAISARRLELLTKSYERATAYAQSTNARVDLAKESLATTADAAMLDELAERSAANESVVEEAKEHLSAAQNAASAPPVDTPEGRSQDRLQQQKKLGAEVNLTLAEVTLAQTQAQSEWTKLQAGSAADLGALNDQALAWSELLRTIDQRTPELRRETEDELLAVQSTNKDGLDRASRRLLDQRVGTAQETLTQIGALNAAVADLELLSRVVDEAIAENTGAFRSWLTTVSRQAKTLYLRIASLADVTLFSVGETPVTGADILRVLIILTVAWLLSRGVRHAIRRVSQSESAGTQASLYTVGRLLHYAIIVIAIFIALSSIGLDFSNLALVAGALSVGIGFGLQSIVNNFVSGLVILFEHSLRVGDYIELDTDLTGTVKAINVRSTLINTNDNIDIVVPNSEFVTSRLTNWTLGERILRVRIPFGVAYGSDKELVKKAAIEAAEEVQYTLTHMKGREPDVWLVDFGDNSLNFLLLVWVNRQGARRPTRTRAAYLWALETKLAEYGIEIPFPQRDLHLRSGWPGNVSSG